LVANIARRAKADPNEIIPLHVVRARRRDERDGVGIAGTVPRSSSASERIRAAQTEDFVWKPSTDDCIIYRTTVDHKGAGRLRRISAAVPTIIIAKKISALATPA
jgi:hypothetical protein